MRIQESPPTRPSLLCRVRTRLCALPLERIVETMRPLPIESVAGVPPFVRGMAVVRGCPVPVVDVGALLETDDPPAPTRFVTVKIGERYVALSVEAVLGIHDLAADSLHDTPPLLREAHPDVLSAMGTLDAELLFLLEAARIVPDSLWQALSTGVTS